ncbi:soluble lamin-associated protein of 75 kDa isoform X3 [Hemicordylus capensis]|uniref:soluble lamin-associated protein of 75 kDa isoform X3 n=1 Tax=Hemicordylus capensis TaxID=884348 RepID=UPI002303903F|nr:soluble lamin-associated protein of 75 kDa isoform X3 [Hemicordylus capensis]
MPALVSRRTHAHPATLSMSARPFCASQGMAFPVDLLDNYRHEDLESSAEDYLSDLRCGDPENPEFLSLVNNVKVPIRLSTVGFVPLYGGEEGHKVLALFAPEDSLAAVALFLADQWWTIDDIVRTTVPSREGLRQVKSIGERVVLYVLNRIIYRKQEIEKNEFPFLCHGSHDYAKILWKKGEAVGFYSVKLPGSICSAFLTQSYQLPVLDTMFVRKKHRGKDFGLLMLEDFVDSFTEDTLGLRFPLTSFMHAACQKYFERYPGDHDLLWEVEGVGHWHQRARVASILQRESFKSIEGSQQETNSSQTEENFLKTVIDHSVPNEQAPEFPETQPSVDSHRNKDGSDVCEGTSEELNAMPPSTRTRSNHLKRPKLGKRIQESDIPESEDVNVLQISENRLEPIIRVSESSEELIDEMEENVTEHEQETFVENQKLPAEDTPQLCSPSEKQDDKAETDIEPLNGELTEDAIKVSIVTEGEMASEDGESKLQSDSPEETTLTLLVPLILDSSVKSAEDSDDNVSDKVENMADLEVPPQEEQQATQRKRALVHNAGLLAPTDKEEPSNNGLSNSVTTEAPEDSISENVSPNTTSSLEEQSEEGGSDSPEAAVALGQGSLVMVELEDISYQQHTEGQKNQLDEQSEESAEPASERAADSSSEEAEIEVPIVDRRTLRRKAKGYKGPPKKKGKLI